MSARKSYAYLDRVPDDLGEIRFRLRDVLDGVDFNSLPSKQ
jgi:hypothetical protein